MIIQLAFELFLQNRDSCEVCNYDSRMFIVLRKKVWHGKEKRRKKKKKAEHESLELLVSGCCVVLGVRIPGMSCLVSGWWCQDVADQAYVVAMAAAYHKIIKFHKKNSKISKNHKKVIKYNAVIKDYYFQLHSAFIHNELNLFLFAMCCIVLVLYSLVI